MAGIDVFRKDLFGIAKDLSARSISSEQLTKLCLSQIDKLDKDIGAMLWVDEEFALKQAIKSDERRKKGYSLSQLDGVPIALKDMILCKGLPSTASSRILEGFIPPYESHVVTKLRQQGAVIIGKTNQDEFAMGSSNECSAYKICKNPFDLTRTPGGSSGGSAAALSAGMCFASLGTDTGGSIRQPASFCGVVGVKPSYGRVSRYGIIAFASSLDQVGPFARTVKDTALLLSAIAGHDPRDSTCVDTETPDYANLINCEIKGKKIGVAKEYFSSGLSDEIQQAITRSIDTLRQSGAEIVEISLPHTKYAVATYYIIATAEASSNLCRYDGVRFGPRCGDNTDLLSLYEETRGKLFGTEVKRRIMLGTYVLSAGYYDAYYLRAQKVRRLFSEDFMRAFQEVDVIISPTTPTTAFKIGEKIDDPLKMYLNDIYTISANLAGICAISLPIGKDSLGLPIGIQLMANTFSEQTLFDIASNIEASIPDTFLPMLK
jgi:aspartyl-tRNA(Asn)/glutamyl-tRNA(Gln) amidotransferase subunit A